MAVTYIILMKSPTVMFATIMFSILMLTGCNTGGSSPLGLPSPSSLGSPSLNSSPSPEINATELYDDSIISYSAVNGAGVEAPSVNIEITKEKIIGYLYPGDGEETRYVDTKTPKGLWDSLKSSYFLVQNLGETTTVEESDLCDTFDGPRNSLLVISGSDVYVDYQMFFCVEGEGFNTAAEEWLDPMFTYLDDANVGGRFH